MPGSDWWDDLTTEQKERLAVGSPELTELILLEQPREPMSLEAYHKRVEEIKLELDPPKGKKK